MKKILISLLVVTFLGTGLAAQAATLKQKLNRAERRLDRLELRHGDKSYVLQLIAKKRAQIAAKRLRLNQ